MTNYDKIMTDYPGQYVSTKCFTCYDKDEIDYSPSPIHHKRQSIKRFVFACTESEIC